MYANLCQPNKIPKQITITKAYIIQKTIDKKQLPLLLNKTGILYV